MTWGFILSQFIFAMLAVCGFAILFRVPLKHIPVCVTVGALCWICYQVSMHYWDSPVLAVFIGSCLAGLLSDICSRLFKEAATMFTIPCMIPLVPGAKIYYTMVALLDHDTETTATIGTETLMMAGAIAAGLLITGALIGIVRRILQKTRGLKVRL